MGEKMIGYSKMPDNSSWVDCKICNDDKELKDGEPCPACCPGNEDEDHE